MNLMHTEFTISGNFPKKSLLVR